MRLFNTVWVAVGMMFFLLGCAPVKEPEQNLNLDKSPVDEDAVSEQQHELTAPGENLPPMDVNIIGDARSEAFVEAAMVEVADIYRQCGLSISTQVNLKSEEPTAELPQDKLNSPSQQHERYPPTVYVIESTLEGDVAFSYLPSINLDVSGTAWITNRVSDACFAWVVAHEIGHIALDSSVHHPDKRNVMNRFCSGNSNFNRSRALPRWDAQQCTDLRHYFTMAR